MCWCRIQASHLIGIYCALLALGVFLEVELPLDQHHHPSDKLKNKSIWKLQKHGESKIMKSDSVVHITLSSSYFGLFSSTEGYSGIENRRSLFSIKRDSLDNDDSLLKFNMRSAMHHEKFQPLKFSLEVNAFDKIVKLLTLSTTYCMELDSMKKINSRFAESVYHCSVQNLSKCNNGELRNKYHKFFRRCSQSKKIAGYNVNPANLVQTLDTRSRSVVTSDQQEEKIGYFGEVYKINIDADCSFVEDFKKLRYNPLMRLDFKLDLVGLNSLHKYEVVVRFLKTVKLVLNRQGYQLERSSADSDALQEYLYQEGLHHPLYVLTLWRRYS